jgi:hypothetical protein
MKQSKITVNRQAGIHAARKYLIKKFDALSAEPNYWPGRVLFTGCACFVVGFVLGVIVKGAQ